MAEIILAAIDQKRASGNELIIFFKTPLTYRWLTRFRSMLSSAFALDKGVKGERRLWERDWVGSVGRGRDSFEFDQGHLVT